MTDQEQKSLPVRGAMPENGDNSTSNDMPAKASVKVDETVDKRTSCPKCGKVHLGVCTFGKCKHCRRQHANAGVLCSKCNRCGHATANCRGRVSKPGAAPAPVPAPAPVLRGGPVFTADNIINLSTDNPAALEAAMRGLTAARQSSGSRGGGGGGGGGGSSSRKKKKSNPAPSTKKEDEVVEAAEAVEAKVAGNDSAPAAAPAPATPDDVPMADK